MALTISDDALRAAGLTEREALIEFACRLFDVGRLSLSPAARVAGLTRLEFENELVSRKIPIFRPTVEEFRQDWAVLGGHGA